MENDYVLKSDTRTAIPPSESTKTINIMSAPIFMTPHVSTETAENTQR